MKGVEGSGEATSERLNRSPLQNTSRRVDRIKGSHEGERWTLRTQRKAPIPHHAHTHTHFLSGNHGHVSGV